MSIVNELAEKYANDRCGSFEECESAEEWEEAKRGFHEGFDQGHSYGLWVFSEQARWRSAKIQQPNIPGFYVVMFSYPAVAIYKHYRKEMGVVEYEHGGMWNHPDRDLIEYWMPIVHQPDLKDESS